MVQVDSTNSGLGTFSGVFTPSILTILGVIMYLRFGWVVGNVGIVRTLLIVTMANSITFLTALSISSIATNQRVQGGGAYYMISRSLGIETGGALGIPLFIALALSVALYTIGFAEAVVGVFPTLDQRTVGLICVVAVAVIALVSAQAAIRVQYVIMAVIVVSLVSLLFGSSLQPESAGITTRELLQGAPETSSAPFWTVFAVFFPAVTGIMAGVNMSGDLRDPNRSIPVGTLAAVGAGYLVYMVLPIILTLRADSATLISDPLVMRRIAFWGDAIILGVWGATLSSAVGSILGAPRVLQALARDGVLPPFLKWLGRGNGPDDEPRLGTIITFGIAFVAVYFGNLNLIAPVLTMFFLTTYGVLNIASGLETLLQSPSFRPSFRVHWAWSFLGALGCIAVMLLINAVATVVALVFMVTISLWLRRRRLRTSWSDLRQGLWLALTRLSLRHMNDEADVKNWRPHVLVLSGAPTQRWHLIDFAQAVSHQQALLSVVTIVTDKSLTPQRLESLETANNDYLQKRGVDAFLRVFKAEDPFIGTERFVQAYGIGPLVPNTVLLGDSEQTNLRASYSQMLVNLHALGRNIVIIKDNSEQSFGFRSRIDVWWGGLKGNGGLMLTLAYLLTTSPAWEDATIHVNVVVADETAAENTHENLEQVIASSRIGATMHVIVAHGQPFADILQAHSQASDLILLGMRAPKDEDAAKQTAERYEDYASYYERLRSYAEDLPTTAFVLAA
ncbi:MAG: amino acid permease, partial [Deinococcota bacterium]